jgi:glucosamine kinase
VTGGAGAEGTWLAIDGGQSASRLRVSWRDGDIEGAGFVHGAGRVERMVEALDPALAALGTLPAIDVIAAGHTGLPVDEEERAVIARMLRDRTGARLVLLAADWVTAHIGALAGGPGVVISAGTGAVALGVTADGRVKRVDGAGYLFGDAGSGFAIGRRALELAARQLDGRADVPAITAAAEARFGSDLHAGLWDLYASPEIVDAVARFAPDVIALAGGGDPTAAEIVAEAADELAITAASAAAPFDGDPVDIAVTGRLLSSDNELARLFVPALSAALPLSDLREASGGSLDGAAALAVAGPGIHAALVHSYPETS